jgi:hypothetical protein
MSIFLVKTFKSYGGRSDSGQYSNSYHIQTGKAIDDAGWVAAVNTIVGAEKDLHHFFTNFMRVLVTPFAENPLNAPARALRTFELQGVGNRNVPAGANGLDLNVCLMIKRQLASGRSGRLYLRGALHEADVQLGANGRFALSPESTFLANVSVDAVARLQGLGPDFEHVIPNPAGLIVQTARVVTAHKIGGVTINRRDHRKRRDTGLLSSVRRLLRDLERQALKLAPDVAAGLLLQGPAGVAFALLRGRAATALAALTAGEVAELALPAILL